MTYLILKWVHIVSATILFGTGIGSAFYMFMAHRQRDIDDIRFATRTVVIADWLFTTPAVALQLATGVALVVVADHDFFDLWVVHALALFVFAGICWLPVVWIQIQMREMAALARSIDDLPQRYWRLNRIWTVLGCLAFPAVVGIFYLMVFRPT